jgi:hypothetical protein
MPIPLIGRQKDERIAISEELRRGAELVERITASGNPVRDWRELEAIRKQLHGVTEVLSAGVTAEHFTRQQIVSIASGLEAVGAQLRLAAGQAPRKKTAPAKRAPAKRAPAKKAPPKKASRSPRKKAR